MYALPIEGVLTSMRNTGTAAPITLGLLTSANLRQARETGSSLQFLYQQSQEVFADSAIETKRPVPERYLTADTEGLRVLCVRFWLYGGGIESHGK